MGCVNSSSVSHSEHELKPRNRLQSCTCDGCSSNLNHELQVKDHLQLDKCDNYCSHPEHKLEKKKILHPYTCDGCKETGFGSRYHCEPCDYDLHEACMFPSPTIHHEFFKNSTFTFFKESSIHNCNKYNCKDHKRYCDACTKPINGFAYQCKEKKFDLHPCCMNLKSELNIHGTKFRLRKSMDVSEKLCKWCDRRKLNVKDCYSSVGGLSYVSENEDYQFHVYCVNEFILESLEKNGGNGNAWAKNRDKNNNDNDDNDCLVLEKIELPIQRLKRNKKDGKWWKIAKIMVKTIIGILLGDPTFPLAFIDLFT